MPLIAWPMVVICCLGIYASLIMLMPRGMYLRLDHEGFEMCSMGRKHSTRWKDVESFNIRSIRGAKFISITYRASFTNQKGVRVVARALSGIEGSIPNSYNVPLAELERVLNRWLKRFG